MAGLVHGPRGVARVHAAGIGAGASTVVVQSAERGHGHALAWQVAGWKTRAVDLEQETLVFERDGAVDDPVQSPGMPARTRDGAVDLDEMFPPYDPGPWPVGLSLRREDLYDDRDR